MTQIVTRQEWGARPARPGGNKFGTILGTAVHWEASAPPAHHSDCDAAVRQIQNYHMDHNGWNDIAYNMVACNHNYLFEGRVGGTAANGTDFGNEHFPSVCWLGGPGFTPTPEALTAISFSRAKLGGVGRPVYPHNHFHPTQCPGPFLTQWVNNGAKAPPPPPPPPPELHWRVTGTDGNLSDPWPKQKVIDLINAHQNDTEDEWVIGVHHYREAQV